MFLSRFFKICLLWTFFCGLIALCSSSCDGIRSGSIYATAGVEIDLDSGSAQLSIANVVHGVKAIPLEVNDSSVISDVYSVKRVLYRDNKYFILDQKFFLIKVFDSTGKYLYQVGGLGFGKGQSMHIEDIEFDFKHGLLMVLSNRPLKISTFTLGGQLVKEEDLDFFASQFAFPSANSRIFYINQNKSELSDNKNLLFTDSNNNVKSRMFNYAPNITSVINLSGGLYSTDQGVYFNPAFSDTFYVIDGDTAKPAFEPNYGSKNIPPGLSDHKILQNFRQFNFPCATFAKFGDYIGFNYYNNSNRSLAFFNTHSRKLITSDFKSDSLNVLFSNYLFENDGKLMVLLDINRLSGFIMRHAGEIQRRFPDLYSHLSIKKTQQNPVLLTFTLE